MENFCLQLSKTKWKLGKSPPHRLFRDYFLHFSSPCRIQESVSIQSQKKKGEKSKVPPNVQAHFHLRNWSNSMVF